MDEMKENILKLYEVFHRGKESAITIDDFLSEYWEYLPDTSRRKFRRIYSQLPICTCNKGGYYPTRKSEIEEFRSYMWKKAIPLFERFNRVYKAYPELSGNIKQLELFARGIE